MSRYILIRRLRAPAFLLLAGINALLAQAHILGWARSWPLYLILAGVLLLAERAALAADVGYPWYASGPYAGVPNPAAAPAPSQSETTIVAGPTHDFDRNTDGGQS